VNELEAKFLVAAGKKPKGVFRQVLQELSWAGYGIDSVESVKTQLDHVDGVMLGRAAYHTPWLLAECQQQFFETHGVSRREDIIEPMNLYLERQVKKGTAVKHISRHLLGLFQGLPGARAWRRYLSENAYRDDDNTDLLNQALAAMRAVGAVQV
jgi:tRNA-dihydrouridine synthase A